ncbi:MAG: PIN domain-containing protein [Deltaproteobacteria bacterium]|nr:PIN domain-containing protein [Deltaproteobacteria bacterium]
MTDSPVILDTSVWVEYFRGGSPTLAVHIERLVAARRLKNLRIITAELLRGAFSPSDRRAIEETVAHIPVIERDDCHWLVVGVLCRRLAKRGVTIPLVDGWIAQATMDARGQLWTLDGDFRAIAKCSPLALYQPPDE